MSEMDTLAIRYSYLFIYYILLNDAVSSTKYITSNICLEGLSKSSLSPGSHSPGRDKNQELPNHSALTPFDRFSYIAIKNHSRLRLTPQSHMVTICTTCYNNQ